MTTRGFRCCSSSQEECVLYGSRDTKHNSDVKWASWCLKSPATQMFVQQIVLTNNKGDFTAPCHWLFVMHWSPVDYTRNWYVMIRALIQYKMTSYQYRISHCGDKTILRPSYLHNGISYTDKMTSLYWIKALVFSFVLASYVQSSRRWFEIPWGSYDVILKGGKLVTGGFLETSVKTEWVARHSEQWCHILTENTSLTHNSFNTQCFSNVLNIDWLIDAQ